ncbi:MAG: hypothetical protein HYY02_11155 [Chloroflexi bacterium]|nr:hypothetical protein [Chloroflexota bacterium]
MQFLLRVSFPTDKGNAMVRDPNFQQKLDQVMGEIKPTAAYFAAENGVRTVYLAVNIANTYEMPLYLEPFWLSFGATVDMMPAMSQEDFGKAMPIIGELVKKY